MAAKEADWSEGDREVKEPALELIAAQPHSIDPAIKARVLRKIDWFLMPAMLFGKPTCTFSFSKSEELTIRRVWFGVL